MSDFSVFLLFPCHFTFCILVFSTGSEYLLESENKFLGSFLQVIFCILSFHRFYLFLLFLIRLIIIFSNTFPLLPFITNTSLREYQSS